MSDTAARSGRGRVRLLGPTEVRRLSAELGIRPTKRLGQNFVVDPGTIDRVVRAAGLSERDVVVEVGPGLGSLTLALLPAVSAVLAIEIDRLLADALPGTVAEHAGEFADRLTVLTADALRITELPGPGPTALVANLPYNVAVPVLLHLLEVCGTLRRGLVMVQAEVAERLSARPGERAYGIPSAKAAWYAELRPAGSVARTVFRPIPNVDSALVVFERRPAPETTVARSRVFAVVDAAFAQRRKTLRAALARWAGTADRAETILRRAQVDPRARGETLGIAEFVRIAEAEGSVDAPTG